MNGEGGIGSAEEDLGYLRGNYVTGFDFTKLSPYLQPDVNVPLGEIYATIAAGIAGAANPFTSSVGIQSPVTPGGSTQGPYVEEIPSVINPVYAETETVFEEALPDVSSELPHTPTDWGEFYDEYVILNPEVPVPVFQEPVSPRGAPSGTVLPGTSQESNVAIDWGEIASTAIGSAFQGYFGDSAPGYGGNLTPTAAFVGAPQTVTVNTRTGKVTPCRRRRRRKLLTESDFNVLLRISTLPNKENVRIALGKAIGRG